MQENVQENTQKELPELPEITVKAVLTHEEFTPKFVLPQQVQYDDGTIPEDGDLKVWEMVKRPDSVHCLVFEEDTGDFILVQQVRIPVLVNDPESKGIMTELCAGLMDNPDMDERQTMLQELKEELGYIVPDDKLMHIKTFKSGVGSTGNNAWYYAAIVNADTERCPVSFGVDENIIERRIPAQEINEFLSSDENMDTGTALTVLGFYLNLINMQDQAQMMAESAADMAGDLEQ